MEALSIQSDKPAVRRHYRETRLKFMTSSGREASLSLSGHLQRAVKDLSQIGTQVCLYRALPEEANAELLPHTSFFFPRLSGETLEFRRPLRDDGFELNSYKIPEPIVDSSEPLDPRRPILVCCPAVAVDWQGGRIGMGKGFYDRFFHDHPKAIRVGVVFQVQVAKVPLPVDSWDQTLDWIVTDKMILRTSDRSS